MTSHHRILLPFAIAAVLATAACNRDADDADTTADTAAADTTTAPADPAAVPSPATDAMAGDPAAAPMPTPADPAAQASATVTVAANDKNADGGVSMDELPPGSVLHEHFSAADTDGNGMLSQAELDKHDSDMASKPQ